VKFLFTLVNRQGQNRDISHTGAERGWQGIQPGRSVHQANKSDKKQAGNENRQAASKQVALEKRECNARKQNNFFRENKWKWACVYAAGV